jgi:phosphate uptake regulator
MQLFRFLTGARPPLIDRAVAELSSMLDISGQMFAAAAACLLDNAPVSLDLSGLDEKVNAGEQEVRRAVLEHLVCAPQDETSFSLLLVSVVQDAERCGDLAKTLAKVSELADGPRSGRHVDALGAIRDRVVDAFPRVRQAFSTGNAEQARQLMDEHAAVKEQVADFLRRVTADAELSPNEAAVLAMAARIVGRTSSHLSNVISAVALPFHQVRSAPTWEPKATAA